MAEYTITEIDLPNGDKCKIHTNATTTSDGLMSKEDKAVLDALASVGSPINFDATGTTVTIETEEETVYATDGETVTLTIPTAEEIAGSITAEELIAKVTGQFSGAFDNDFFINVSYGDGNDISINNHFRMLSYSDNDGTSIGVNVPYLSVNLGNDSSATFYFNAAYDLATNQTVYKTGSVYMNLSLTDAWHTSNDGTSAASIIIALASAKRSWIGGGSK